MKVLLHYLTPFALAHGGLQIQIVQTRAALESIGVDVEYLRWYDGSQTGDILHFFGRVPAALLMLARQKGMKIVMADLLTEQGSRSRSQISTQRLVMRAMGAIAPGLSEDMFGWQSYRNSDACIALTKWEAELMTRLFDAPPEKIRVVPNGVEEVFLQSKPVTRGPWLVCTATITERKRIVELAEAAVAAQMPLWVIGKAYSDMDPYAKRFSELAKRFPKLIRYEGEITERKRMAEVYREARGFVLLSAMESLSLSALEAAACECPMLLSDLPWARTYFKETVSYCPVTPDTAQTAAALKKFYDAAPGLKPPGKPLSWVDVAMELKKVYDSVFTDRSA